MATKEVPRLAALLLALTAASAAAAVAVPPAGGAATASVGGRRMLLQGYTNGGSSSSRSSRSSSSSTGGSSATDGEGGGGELQATASPAPPPPPPLSLPPLPYGYDTLEPVISSQIMRLHHDVHEAGYASKTAALLAQLPPLQPPAATADGSSSSSSSCNNLTLLLTQVGSGRLPITAAQETTLRNQGGGLWNHQLFWKVMASPGSAPTSRSAISPALLSAIQRAFGSVDEMLAQLKGSADAVFGSGWAWVCVPSTAGDSNASGGGGGGLQLLTTANQDNPLMKVVRSQPCAPILGIDVWEHAYYLQYQAKRSDYTQAWQQQLINWAAVSAFYEAAAAGDLSYNDT